MKVYLHLEDRGRPMFRYFLLEILACRGAAKRISRTVYDCCVIASPATDRRKAPRRIGK